MARCWMADGRSKPEKGVGVRTSKGTQRREEDTIGINASQKLGLQSHVVKVINNLEVAKISTRCIERRREVCSLFSLTSSQLESIS